MMSKQPRKQRKWRYTAALHQRKQLVHSHLSDEAQKKLKTKMRALSVRQGDKVKVMRGKWAKHTGKVSVVDLMRAKIFVEGVVARKSKGQERMQPIDPSNVMIIDPVIDKGREEIAMRNPLAEKAVKAAKTDVEPKARQAVDRSQLEKVNEKMR